MSEHCPIQQSTEDLKEQVAERGPWIFTFSGRRYFPVDPRPEEVFIGDIAHALSQINRYTGHTRVPVSVAEHSLLCEAAASRGCALEALLHDAAEAYLGDLSRPVKQWLNEDAEGCRAWSFGDLEDRNANAIARRFNLAYPWDDEIKYIDNRVLATEVRDAHCEEFHRLLIDRGIHPYPCLQVIQPRPTPEALERLFLVRFESLRRDA